MSRSILAFCALLATAAAGQASDRTDVIKFLKDHVIGKTLATPPTASKSNDGKFEETYEDQATFSNLVETEDGCTFDLTVKAKQAVYDLDKDGKRILPGRDQSGTTVFRYELVERKSTHKLMGYWRVLSTTVKDRSPVGTVATVVHPQVSDGQLIWKESQAGYSDAAAEKGKFKPGAYSSVSKLSLVDGKLQWSWEQVNFDVDPETLKRTPTKDVIPTTISKEVDKRETLAYLIGATTMTRFTRLVAFLLILAITGTAAADLLPRPRPRPTPYPFPVPVPIPQPPPPQPPPYQLPAPDPLPQPDKLPDFSAPRDVKLAPMPLVIDVDDNVNEARLEVPSAAFRFRAGLDNADPNERRADSGRPRVHTIVSGLSLSLAFCLGGVWLVRRRSCSGVQAGTMLVITMAATVVFASNLGAWSAGPRFAPGADGPVMVGMEIKVKNDGKMRLVVNKKQFSNLVDGAK